MQFSFGADRSTKPEDQIDGLECGRAIVSGDFSADDTEAAWAIVKRLLAVPGLWTIQLRWGQSQAKTRRVRVASRVEG